MIIAILLLTGFFILNRTSPKFWMFAWPGTVVHESLHWTVGKIMGANPTSFSVLPKKGTNIIGEVNFTNITWFNCVPVTMAPLLAIPISYIIYGSFHIMDVFTISGILTVWIFSAVLALSWPTYIDFKLSTRHPKGWILWGGLAVLFLYNKYPHVFG